MQISHVLVSCRDLFSPHPLETFGVLNLLRDSDFYRDLIAIETLRTVLLQTMGESLRVFGSLQRNPGARDVPRKHIRFLEHRDIGDVFHLLDDALNLSRVNLFSPYVDDFRFSPKDADVLAVL